MKSAKARRYEPSRDYRGNMLIFSCVLMTMVSVMILIAYSFGGLFLVKNRLKSTADEIALVGACTLNEADQLGQINNITMRARQMVYVTAQNAELVQADQLSEQLAQQLLNEARNCAHDIAQERRRIVEAGPLRAKAAMQKKFEQVQAEYAIRLPWLVVSTPEMEMSLGKLEGMQSSVPLLSGVEDLASQDRVRGYVSDPQIAVAGVPSLYKAERELKLDGEPISFGLSPLAAPVDNEVSQARVVAALSKQKLEPGYEPSATQVTLSIKINSGLTASGTGQLSVTSCAVATGGGLMQ